MMGDQGIGSARSQPGCAEVEPLLQASESSAAFTPGPWKVQHDLIISRATYDTICAVKRPANPAWTVENPEVEAANARLIAAAPDAVQLLMDLDASPRIALGGTFRRRIREVLAKALGAPPASPADHGAPKYTAIDAIKKATGQ